MQVQPWSELSALKIPGQTGVDWSRFMGQSCTHLHPFTDSRTLTLTSDCTHVTVIGSKERVSHPIDDLSHKCAIKRVYFRPEPAVCPLTGLSNGSTQVNEVGWGGGECGVIHFKLASWVGREEPCCNPIASGSQS